MLFFCDDLSMMGSLIELRDDGLFTTSPSSSRDSYRFGDSIFWITENDRHKT